MLGLYWDNGKENGNYYIIVYRGYIGSYWDNGKENGNYYSMLGLYRGYIGFRERAYPALWFKEPEVCALISGDLA